MIIIQTHLDELLEFPAITKENKAECMRQLIWHIQTHLSSLKTLAQPVEAWDTIIIHLAKRKLEFAERRDWQNIVKDRTPEDMPKLIEFIKFLTERCHTIRLLEQGKQKQPSRGRQFTYKQEKGNEKKIALVSTSITCKICNGNHPIYKCEEFLKLAASHRKKKILELRLCINCLSSGHYARDCKLSTCKRCKGKHHSLIHQEQEEQEEQNNNPTNQSKEDSTTSVVTYCTESTAEWKAQESQNIKESKITTVYCIQNRGTRIILPTAQISVQDKDGREIRCRVLLDPGSQLNLITNKLVQQLKLPCKSKVRPVSGINRTLTNTTKVTHLIIKSLHNNFQCVIECLVMPEITEQLPQTKFNITNLVLPHNTKLADPAYETPGPIEMLIGAGIYWKILIEAPLNQIKGQPALQNTYFGMIVGGEMKDESSYDSLCSMVTNAQLQQQLEKFWIQEEPSDIRYYSAEEMECEKYFCWSM